MTTSIDQKVTKRPTCTDMASRILEKFVRMRETLDRIEGVDSDQKPGENKEPGSLPRLELQLNTANKDATVIMDRLCWLADRI